MNSSHANMASRSEATGWCVLFIAEALAIVIGNIFSIIKFAKTGKLYRRSSYLLINLAFADILVGAFAVPMFAYSIAETTGNTGAAFGKSYKAVDIISGLASIMSLTLVSLERLYATIWPIRHKVMSTTTYAVGIACVWLTACVIPTIGIFIPLIPRSIQFLLFSSVFIVSVCCVTICAANLAIWIGMNHRQVTSHCRNEVEQQRRLSVTLMLVAIISLCAWLPFTLVNLINQFYHLGGLTLTIVSATKLLHYGNSCANVFVYSYRILEFRKFFINLFCCQSTAVEEDTVMLGTELIRISKDSTALQSDELMLKSGPLFNGQVERSGRAVRSS